MTNEDEILKNRCQISQVDYALTNRLKTKIFPLLEEAHIRQGYLFDKAFLEQLKGTIIRLENAGRLMQILPKLNPKAFAPIEARAIALHLEFLPVCEGYFTPQINFLVFVLIANGHDLYSTYRGKYVKTLDAIEEIDLAFKLKFLKEHGFDELTKPEKNFRQLRNSIAHLFYQIDTNGDLKIEKKPMSSEDYTELYFHLRNVAMGIEAIEWLYYRRFAIPQASLEQIRKIDFEEIICNCGYGNLAPKDRKTLKLSIQCTNCGKPL
jgi:hypothetical protein